MKKKILCLIIGILLLFPLGVRAEGIENYFINATVKNNGDLEVEEYFYLDGSFNGMERIIKYKNSNTYEFDSNSSYYGGSSIHNGDGIVLKSIKALPINSNFSFNNTNGDSFKEVESASKGQYGVYIKNSVYDGETYKIFLPSSKKKAFYLKYILKNMAILHNDVGEIGWNVVGSSLSEDIDSLTVYLNFPDNKNELRGWAHGPLNGNIEIVSKNKIKAAITNLNRYTAIDIRATFDKEQIINSNKLTNVDALSKILSYEENEANKANYEREQNEKKYEEDALEAIMRLEKNPTRYNFDYALEQLNYINNNEVKEEYKTRILQQEENVINYEIKEAEEDLKLAKYYKDYTFYSSAKKSIKEVKVDSVKEKMLKELEVVKQEIIKKEKKNELANTYIVLGVIVLLVIIYLVYYYLFIKEAKPEFREEYLRDIPSNLSPAGVCYLYKKKIDKTAISATILDFIDRGIITYEKDGKNNYTLTLKDIDKDNMSNEDKKFIIFLFHNKNKVNIKDFKKSNYQIKNSLSTKYDNWKKSVINNLENTNLIEKDENNLKAKQLSTSIIWIIILCFIPFIAFLIPIIVIYFIYKLLSKKSQRRVKFVILECIIFIISLFSLLFLVVENHFLFNSIFMNVIAIIIYIVILNISKVKMKRTEKGVEELARWKALRRFMLHFSDFSDREVGEIKIWNKYLVYATVLGCSEKLAQMMQFKLNNVDQTVVMTGLLVNNFSDFNNLSRNITHNMSSGSYATYSSSGSSYSSGSGSGGGFSGGSSSGGSFGGGGGGGRF